MKVSVIGMGSWGTALAKVLSENGHQVIGWLRNQEQCDAIKQTHENERYLPGILLPHDIECSTDLAYALEKTEMIIFAVPTQSFSKMLQRIIEEQLMPPSAILVNVAKGIEISSLHTISQIIQECSLSNPYVVLSGPSHAEEVGKKCPTAIVAASTDENAAICVQEVLSNDYMRIYTGHDVLGVELSGALKNIIALAAGVLEGMGYGDNAKAALITRGIHEIQKLGMVLGAQRETFSGLAGVGDMIVTCMSEHSRNRRCGILIGQGVCFEQAVEQIGMVVEGAYTCKAAYALMQNYGVEMPITTELYRVLYENQAVDQVISRLMRRKRKRELDVMD